MKTGIKNGAIKILFTGVVIIASISLLYTYIHHVFLDEVMTKLSDAAKENAVAFVNSEKNKNVSEYENEEITSEFLSNCYDGKCYFAVIDELGTIEYKQEDYIYAASDLPNTIAVDFCNNYNKDRQTKLMDSVKTCGTGTAELRLSNGELLYVSVVPIGDISELYSVAAVTENDAKEEMKDFLHVVYGVILLILIVMFFGLIYFSVQYYRDLKLRHRFGELQPVPGISDPTKHAGEVTKLLLNHQNSYAYVVVNMNNYQFMKELFGFDYGSNIKLMVATCLIKHVNREERIGQISETEIGLLLKYTDEITFRSRLDQMLREAGRIAEDNLYHINTLAFSCGVYVILNHKDSYRKIKSLAQSARKSTKPDTKYSVFFYQNMAGDNEITMAALEKAMLDREFIIYLQPRYTVDGDEVIGAEAFVRWEHPKKGVISPGVFLPLFEENGFVKTIDFFVLEEVCKVLRYRIDHQKKQIPISMNVSSQLLKEKNIVRTLTSLVDLYQVPHHLIEIELSESDVYENMEAIKEIVFDWKAEGFIVSLDNFGSGYSYLEAFKQIPFDVIKLDKDLLKNYENEEEFEDDKLIITHIIAKARELHGDILIKGIETKEQKKLVKETSCNMTQGFLYAKPMPIEKFNQIG